MEGQLPFIDDRAELVGAQVVRAERRRVASRKGSLVGAVVEALLSLEHPLLRMIRPSIVASKAPHSPASDTLHPDPPNACVRVFRE